MRRISLPHRLRGLARRPGGRVFRASSRDDGRGLSGRRARPGQLLLTGTRKDRQVRPPRSDRIRVLVRHDADDLADVTQIVRHPRRQMLPEGDDPEFGMPSVPIEIAVGKMQRAKAIDAVAPQARERVEEIVERPALRRPEHRLAIEWRERDRVPVAEDVVDARHPVSALPVNQMADDVERTPGAGPFGRLDPIPRQIGEQRANDARRAAQDRQGGVEVKFHKPNSSDIAISATSTEARVWRQVKTGLNSRVGTALALASALQ